MATSEIPPEYTPEAPAAQPVSTYIKPQYRPPHDPTICFEEYHHYAKITREKELTLEAPKLIWREFFSRKKPVENNSSGGVTAPGDAPGNTFPTEKGTARLPHGLEITDEEWENAGRALRTASTGACKDIN